MSGVELATAWVRIVPTMDGIQGAISGQLGPAQAIASQEGTKAGGMFSSGFASKLGGVALALGAAFATRAVVNWAKDSIDALKNWEVVNAQTEAVIASTGGAAGVTADHVHELATSLEAMTASQAEGIQEGANLLLTFKNIRNEAGAGNDIFNQATASLVDMARAMGTDPQNAAIQLGKALNDPIAGMASLSRMGVQFTQQQKDTVASLVESGQTMEAQKIILAELQSQFGGSGAAYADTFAGKMYLLNDAVGDLGESMFSALMPALVDLATAGTAAFGWIGSNLPTVTALAVAVAAVAVTLGVLSAAAAVGAAGGLAAWAAKLPIVTGAQWLWNAALAANPIGIVITLIAAIVAALIWFFTQTELGQEIWANVTAAIGAAATWLWESVLQPVFAAIGAVWDWLYNNVILPVITGIMIYIGLWAAIFTWLWETILQPVFAAIGAVFEWLWANVISPVVGFIVAYIQAWGAILGWLYENAVRPALDAVGAAFEWVWRSIISPVVDFISNAIRSVGSTVQSVFGGISDFIGAAFQATLSVVRGPINALIDLINGVIGGLNSIRVDIPDWVPIVGGSTFGLNIPRIPKLAAGGIVMPQPGGVLSLLAERNRPEVVLPLDRLRDFLPVDGGFGGAPFIYNAAENRSFDRESELWAALERREAAGW